MKLLKIVAACFILTVLFLLLMAYLAKKVEIVSNRYGTYTDIMLTKGAFASGWIPRWLPKSARNIYESHNIDTNQIWVMFEFTKSDSFFEESCSSIKKDETPLPAGIASNKFPDFVSVLIEQINNNSSLKFYLCGSNKNLYMAIDEAQLSAYLWGYAKTPIQ